MTITMERAAVVMTTADGESREAQTWPDGSYACGFCQTPVFSPEGWEAHEQGNAECYAKTGETYTAEPYADYHRRHYMARECPNPMCLANITGDELARVRENERRQQERKDRDATEKAREQAKQEAADARNAAQVVLHASVRPIAEQLGFAWCCTHTTPARFYGDEPVMCESSGWDRDEFTAHIKSHGAKPLSPSVKRVKLRKVPAAVKMPALEVDVFSAATWTETHTPEATCRGCQHTINQHKFANSTINGSAYDCRECDCAHVYHGDFTRHESQTAERSGQYLANGPAPHSVWVIPFAAAPWEDGNAAPVLLYVGSAGRYFTDSYSAKYDRRAS